MLYCFIIFISVFLYFYANYLVNCFPLDEPCLKQAFYYYSRDLELYHELHARPDAHIADAPSNWNTEHAAATLNLICIHIRLILASTCIGTARDWPESNR